MHIAFPRGAACSRCRRTSRFVRLSNTPRTGGMLRDAVARHEEEEEEEGNSSNFMPRLTFDRFSFAIVERKREKRKKEKEGTTLHYIYIIYTLLTVRKLSFCDHSSILALSRPGTEYSKGRIAIIARLSQVSRKARWSHQWRLKKNLSSNEKVEMGELKWRISCETLLRCGV